jgi:hypothetical protein
MSQFPFPQVPYTPPSVDPRMWGMASHRPGARAAGIWQAVLGGLIFFLGSCALAAVWIAPDQIMVEALRQQKADIPKIEGLTPQQEIRLAMTLGSGVMIFFGAVLSLLAVFVRRGGKIAIITSMVMNGLLGLLMLVNFAVGLRQIAANPMAIVQVLMVGGFLALVVTTFTKLIAALHSAGSNQQMAMQQQAYYWMMQQQGGYGAGTGYGYGQAPATPPPPPPPLPIQPPPPPPPP